MKIQPEFLRLAVFCWISFRNMHTKFYLDWSRYDLVMTLKDSACLLLQHVFYCAGKSIQSLSEIVNHSSLTHDKNVEEKLAHEMSYQFNFYLSSNILNASLPPIYKNWMTSHMPSGEFAKWYCLSYSLSEKFENVLSRAIRIWITVRKFLWPVLSANIQIK